MGFRGYQSFNRLLVHLNQVLCICLSTPTQSTLSLFGICLQLFPQTESPRWVNCMAQFFNVLVVWKSDVQLALYFASSKSRQSAGVKLMHYVLKHKNACINLQLFLFLKNIKNN